MGKKALKWQQFAALVCSTNYRENTFCTRVSSFTLYFPQLWHIKVTFSITFFTKQLARIATFHP